MEVNFNKFKDELNFSVLVHFPGPLCNLKKKSDVSFVCQDMQDSVESISTFLNPLNDFSGEKISQVLEMVKLEKDLDVFHLTTLEIQKLQLAKTLLHLPKMIVLEYFFDNLIYSEREYFKRLFRNLIYKKKVSIVLIEKDMNFIVETVKKIYLFEDGFKWRRIDDFYDESIYSYVEMPYTVELVKYLESKGHVVDHDFTFLETLKAIYRGVS